MFFNVKDISFFNLLLIFNLSVFITSCLGSKLPLPDTQIVGGTAADISQFPHQLSLQTTGHICGASVINSQWAITAAHCVTLSANRYHLRAGSTYKDQGTIYTLKRIIVHPNYNSKTIDYDIALLQIDGTIQLNSNVQPVKLAPLEPKAGTIVTVTGWGALKQGGSTSARLMQVSIPIVDRAQCQKAYKNYNTITDRMICAGYTQGGKDSCQGDSGGPMVAQGTLYGIVSWGYKCAEPNYPGVYTNVAHLRSWIKSNSGV